MSDLIERQEIIDRLDRVIEKGLVNILSGEHPITAEVMKEVIMALPSAEPDLQPTCNQLAKDANVPCKDTISRQNAIDMIMGQPPETHYPSWYAEQIKALPSAQPEQLTDKEQRIFLAAMGREEKVCKQVDDERRNCREPYEDSLVRTCHEITRKVKGALWMI